MQKKKVVILGTGGTIAGKATNSTETARYQAGEIEVQELIQEIPELLKLAEIEVKQIFNIDSADISLEMMAELREQVNKSLQREDVTGVVITHGTDTLEETAYFLQLTVNSTKPVIIVGAMRPATALSADGVMNLLNAVQVAITPQAVNKGVLVVMNEKIYTAREVTKTHTTNIDSFKAIEGGCLGYVNNNCVEFYRQSLKKHTVNSCFAQLEKIADLKKVTVLYCVAGMDFAIVESLIAQGNKGLIIAGFGNGNINGAYKQKLRQIAKQGISVMMSSRVGQGAVTGQVEEKAAGILTANNLNPQKARILLMLALELTQAPQQLQKIFNEY